MILQEVKIEIHENLGAENLESFASVVRQLRTFYLFLTIPLPSPHILNILWTDTHIIIIYSGQLKHNTEVICLHKLAYLITG